MKKIFKRGHKKRQTGFLFVLPSLSGVLFFILIPFADVVRRSFTEAVSGAWVGLANFRTIFSNKAFCLAAVNTLRFEGICIPLLLVLSLLTALILDSLGEHVQFFKSCFLIPMAIPVASAVLLWKVLFHERGLLGGLLHMLHIPGEDWMRTPWAFWILVASYIWKNLGYDLILWLAGLSGISPSLYEAAQVDGAGRWQCFCCITLPGLLPSLFTISVLSILNSFKVFREAYLAAGDYPHASMYLLQHVFNNWYRDLSMDKMAAGAVVHAGVIFLLVLFLKRKWEG
ncbi:MAG: sugar ABC transporter permease [Lachnospiraceae bacterium]|jgi:ABC-type sugar transport systems, permease components|nr:sugar ABC transporter permease [Lachnospiraceae bacterium]